LLFFRDLILPISSFNAMGLSKWLSCSFALAGDYFEGSRRDRIIGLQSAFGTFGGGRHHSQNYSYQQNYGGHSR